MNKKAQIGEGFTWVVATIIIVFLLLLFFMGISLLSTQIEKPDVSYTYEKEMIYGRPNIALDFLRENKEVIVNFSEIFLNNEVTSSDFRRTDIDMDYYNSVSQLKDIFSEFSNIEKYGLENPVLYLGVKSSDEDKVMCFKKGSQGVYLGSGKNFNFVSGENGFGQRVFYLSDDGNLIMLFFYDEEPLNKRKNFLEWESK